MSHLGFGLARSGGRTCAGLAALLAVAVFLAGCQPEERVGPDEEEMRALFVQARELDEQGRHRDAMVRYETILARHPEWMSTRLNAAMAAYDAEECDKAVTHFELLHKCAPTDWFILRKLIQCYERLGNKAKVDEFRAKLASLRERQDGSPLLKSYQGFTRDYLPVGTMHLIGYEFFDPQKHGRLWLFKLEDRHRQELSTFLLWASPFHLRSGQRLFYLTEVCPGWVRVWHVGPEGREYDWARAQVLDILRGRRTPLLAKPVPVGLEVFSLPGAEGPETGRAAAEETGQTGKK